MMTKVLLCALLGLALAESERGSVRQARQFIPVPVSGNTNCPDYFQLTSNPCVQGSLYFPVAADPRKFVQCDALGRAYVIQCPQGLLYNATTTTCQQPPQVQFPTRDLVNPGASCTVQALQTGQIYFPYIGDKTRFYQCIAVGQAQTLQCPQGLVWGISRIACEYEAQQSGLILTPTVYYSNSVQFNNPCMGAGSQFYFAHPDPTKFIQCDTAGRAFVLACPSGLLWWQQEKTCAWPYSLGVVTSASAGK